MVLRVSHCACACGERAATAKMTSLLLVLAAFLAFSEAVSPPNLADTFIATGEVEIHTAEGTSIGGKCKRCFLYQRIAVRDGVCNAILTQSL